MKPARQYFTHILVSVVDWACLFPRKRLSPLARTIQFLGLMIDTKLNQVQVPNDKVQRAVHIIQEALLLQCLTKHHVQRIIGFLTCGSWAITPGRAHLHSLINLCASISEPHSIMWLTTGVRLDLDLWLGFLQYFNGVSYRR